MTIDENTALEITAVRAIEHADAYSVLWTDGDRTWASRAAAEIVGEHGTSDAFLVARARLVLERIGERSKVPRRVVRALRWRPWVGVTIVVVAFVAGLAINQVGGSQRINLLAPPLFGLLLWNISIYAVLAISLIARYGEPASPGPMRKLVMRIAAGSAGRGRGELAPAITRLADDWSSISARLYGARVTRILHFAAAMFAIGLVVGLYVRGVAFEYRATWESTFLDGTTVHRLLSGVLTPGAAISGIAVPSEVEVESIRAPASENAARWLHLIAATVALTVVIPRLLLALWARLVERYREGHLLLPLEDPYFGRLLRGFRGGAVRVRVAPYSYTIPPGAAAGLERLIRAVFGENAYVTIMAPAAYGSEDSPKVDEPAESPASVIALFNATATPERETHGTFLDGLAPRPGSGGTLVALVDESAFRNRLGNDGARLEERRSTWRALCADRHVACSFAALAASDLSQATAELEYAVEGVMH